MLRKLILYRKALRSPTLIFKGCPFKVLSDITSIFIELCQDIRKIIYVFLTRLPLSLARSLDLHA